MADSYFDALESIPKGLNNNSHRRNLWNYFVYGSTLEELNDSKYFSLKSIPCTMKLFKVNYHQRIKLEISQEDT